MPGQGDPDFHDIVARIEAAASLAALREAMERLCAEYQLACACYEALRTPPAAPGLHLHVRRAEGDCLGAEAVRRYAAQDPAMLALLGSPLPIDWEAALPAAAGAAARRAISVPIRGPGGAVALFSVAGLAEAAEWPAARRAIMRDMHLVALHLHARVLALTGGDAPPPLSARERECLAWAAAGKTIEDTATILGLSVRAVRGYLDSARRKLNCLTKTHAAVRAVQLGLVAP